MLSKLQSTFSLVSIISIILLAYHLRSWTPALPYSLQGIRSRFASTASIATFSNATLLPTYSSTMSSQRVSRKLAKPPVLAVEQQEGVGAVVRRSIGGPNLRNWTPFLSEYILDCWFGA